MDNLPEDDYLSTCGSKLRPSIQLTFISPSIGANQQSLSQLSISDPTFRQSLKKVLEVNV